ncbi:MAG: hypothetical protein AAGC55_16050, partial [Myxococcota bacterium]
AAASAIFSGAQQVYSVLDDGRPTAEGADQSVVHGLPAGADPGSLVGWRTQRIPIEIEARSGIGPIKTKPLKVTFMAQFDFAGRTSWESKDFYLANYRIWCAKSNVRGLGITANATVTPVGQALNYGGPGRVNVGISLILNVSISSVLSKLHYALECRAFGNGQFEENQA